MFNLYDGKMLQVYFTVTLTSSLITWGSVVAFFGELILCLLCEFCTCKRN